MDVRGVGSGRGCVARIRGESRTYGMFMGFKRGIAVKVNVINVRRCHLHGRSLRARAPP